jgi:hypothetical protein
MLIGYYNSMFPAYPRLEANAKLQIFRVSIAKGRSQHLAKPYGNLMCNITELVM